MSGHLDKATEFYKEQNVSEDKLLNQFGSSKFFVTFVDKDNSTCNKKTTANEIDYSSESKLKMSYNGEYLWTNEHLNTYYKPLDAFVCCYLSATYGKVYSDGYGLNFYTHEYGYYEYCDNDTDSSANKKGGATGIIAGVGAAVILAGVVYCYFKRDEGKDRGEESGEDAPTQNITYNISNTVVN